MKKVLSLFLAVLMTVSFCCTGIYAADVTDVVDNEAGISNATDESSGSIVSITTADELKAVADAVNSGQSYEGKTVVLANDIDMNYTAVVIGTKAHPFKGTFDGQGHTVSNLSIYEDGSDSDYFANTDDCLGLFGVINTPAVVMNVTVCNPYIVGSAYVGGIVGMAYTGTISNCHVTGEIDIEGNYMVGGITGHGYAKIYDCSVIGAEGWGYNYIGATYKEADLEGDNVGGIVGHNAETNTISGCTVQNVTVSGTRKVGGIVGITAQNGTITDCTVKNVIVETTATADYAAANAATMSIGGIVGQYQVYGSNNGTLSDCTVSGLTFVNDNNVTVSAGAITGGLRGTSNATVAPADTVNVSGVTVSDVTGSTVEYLEPVTVEVATFDELVAALVNGGNIVLTAGITTTAALVTSGVTAIIDLNGYTLKIGAGDNKFNDATTLTIKNGNINIDEVVVSGNAIFCLDEYEKTLVTTLTLTDVNLTGKDYSSAYGVFYIGASSVLNVNGGEWTLTNDIYAAGGVFKADSAAATLNIANAKMTLHNVRRVVTYADTTIGSSVITITGDADGVDIEMEHGFNRSPLAITNSTITMENLVGRGITAECGPVTISDDSTVTIKNAQEATIDVRGGKTVTVDDTSTVSVDAEPTITSGSIVGAVKLPATGTVTPAYTKEVDGYVRVWGEGGGNASESYVLKLYSDDTLIATTTLNNVGGIIDGDVYVTWNFYYPESSDEYWTTTWEEGHPNSAAQPTKVELYIDGEKVAENVAKMSGPDDLNKVVWEELGGVEYIVTGLKGAGTEADPYLIRNIEELKWFRDDVNAGNTYAGKVVKLTDNIDLAGEQWTAIGTSTKPFKGTFDGGNNTISNLKIVLDTESVQRAALFGQANNATIKNLNINNVEAAALARVSAIVGGATSTKIDNCHVTGDINLCGYQYVGAIVGYGYVTVTNCSVAGDADNYADYTVPESDSYGKMYMGGIAGWLGEGNSTISGCSVKYVNLTTNGNVGAITGLAHYGNTVSGCTAEYVNIKANSAVQRPGTVGLIVGGCAGTASSPSTISGNTVSNITAEDGDKTVTAIYGTDPVGNGTEAVTNYVAEVNGVLYESLQTAIDKAGSGDTVKLLRDITVTESVVVAEGGEISLDLNGKTLQTDASVNDETAVHTIINKGTLTVIDSVGGGAVVANDCYTAEDGTKAKNGYAINSTGTLVIDGAKIEGTNWGYAVVVSGKTTIEEGSVINGRGAVYAASGAELTINGGEFKITVLTTNARDHVICLDGGDAVINGGTFDGTVKTLGSGQEGKGSSAVMLMNSASSVVINGGTFVASEADIYGYAGGTTATVNDGDFKTGLVTRVGAEIELYGGSYTYDPTDYCATGFVPERNVDGTYGVIDDPATLYINNLDELKAFRDDVNEGNTYKGVTVYLAADIDLASAEWTPIGNSTNKFQGTFDGQNHTVSNLVITGNNSNVGFFGYTTNGEVKNLTIDNALVSGRLNVGVVAGTPYTSKYTNITVTGHVEVNGMSYVGGVGGKNAYADWTDITVDADATSYVKATSTENGVAYRTYVGGVIGFLAEGGHTFKNITSNIDVIGDVCDVGGITGIAHYGNNFVNVTCSGDVTNTNSDVDDVVETGGIAGVWHNGGSAVTFEDCVYTGKLSAPNAEGVVFSNGGLIGPSYKATGTGEMVIDYEAYIGTTVYETLDEAIAAVKEGETVVLFKDITRSDIANAVNITGSVSFTLDLNGKAIDANTTNAGVRININNENVTAPVEITLKNGTINAGSSAYCALIAAGKSKDVALTVNVEDVEMTNCHNYGFAVKAFAYATVNLKEGTKIVSNDGQGGAYAQSGSVINIYEGVEIVQQNTATTYMGANLGVSGTGVMNVYGGTFTSDKYNANVMSSGGELNISGGTFVSDVYGVHVDSWDANISAPSVANITGGTFTAPTVIWVGANEGEQYSATAKITGGTFNGKLDGTYGGEQTVIAVSGGTFDQAVAAEYCAEGYIPATNEDGTYGVKVGSYVASVNGVKYETIAEALTAAQAGDTVTILAGEYTGDVSVNKAITLIGETDAEGNNLVTINGKLSVTGSGVTVKNLNVNNSSERAMYVSGGNILIEGCNLTGVHGLRYCYANNGDVTLKDCVITGSTYGVHFDAGNGEGNVIIDGCTITGWTSFGSAIEGVTITGTEFKDGNYDVLRFYQDATLTGCIFSPATTVDFGKDEVTANFNDCSVVDGSALTEVIYLGDIASMGVKVYEDEKLITVEASVTNADGKTEYYLTLADAFAAAQAGDTVTLLDDVTLSSKLTIDKAVTIDGDGHSIIADENAVWYTVSGKLNIKNYSPWVLINDNATLTNIVINSNNCAGGVKIGDASNMADVVFDNVTISGAMADALTVYGSLSLKNYINVSTTYSVIDAKGGVVTAEPGTVFDMAKFSGSVSPVTSDLTGAVNTDGEPYFAAYSSTTYYKDLTTATSLSNLTLLKDVTLQKNFTNASGTLKLDGNDLIVADGYTVTVSKSLVIEGEGNISGDFKLSAGATLTAPEGMDVVTVDGYRVVYENGVYTSKEVVYVAQIGETKYETLAEAFAAAQDGDEVKILVAGTYTLSTSGKDITVTGAVDGVVFDNIGAKNMGGANVTFNNVTFDYYPNVNYTGLQHSGNLVYNNCTFNGQVFLYGANETFNNCTFNQNSADAYNVWTYGAKVVEFIECTFNSAGKSVLVYNEGACATDLTVTDSAFIASASVEGKAAIEIDTSLMPDGTNIVINNSTATGFAAGSISGNSLWNDKKDQTDLTVTVDDVKVWPKVYVAQIGDKKYETFEEAVANIATDGSDTTIKLLCDIEVGADIAFKYGTGTITFTADEPVTVKQTALGTDFDFVEAYANKIVIGENVTFEVYDNASGIYLYYGPSMELHGTVTGGQNWGALYLYQGTHTVTETGKIGVGRVQLGYTELTVNGTVDTNYLLVEGSSFTADGATVDAGVIYDNNNGGQRRGASVFNIVNGTAVTASSVTLSYADTVLNMDLSSRITADKITGAGKIVIDASGFNGADVSVIIADTTGFTGTVEVVNADGATFRITDTGIVVTKKIPELPTATVTNIANEDLTFALNFKADEVTAEQLAYYGDWYADFVLTINKNVTFNANGGADGYLSGQYDAWSENWVNVPFDDVTMKADESLKIMEYAASLMGQSGLKLTYNDVYSFVKNFDCGVYFTPEFLAANPDLEVTLELRMYNPEDETESYAIGKTYEFEAPTVVAKVGTKGYATLADAIAAAKAGDTVELLADIALSESVAVEGNVTIDLNGKTLTGGIVLTTAESTVTAPATEGLKVTTIVEDSSVVYAEGVYSVVSNNILWGDVDGDNDIDGTDAMLLNRYASGWAKSDYANADSLVAGDVNGDGIVNGTDAMLLNRYASGWAKSDYTGAINLLKSLEKLGA